MSETVDALERRLSPARLKHEAKSTVHETIDEVRYRLNPQRLAEQAGRSMLDTVKDHPIPSLLAGLSLGYLLMKAGDHSSHRDYDYDGRRRYAGRPYRGDFNDVEAYGVYPEREYGRAPDRYARYGRDVYEPDAYERDLYERDFYEGDIDYDEGDGRSMKEKASDTVSNLKEQAGDLADQAGHLAGQAQHQAASLGRQVRYRARRAENDLEDFLYENPLAAGAVAIGVGALIGGLLPSTRREDELMGDARDEVVHRAANVAQKTLDRAKQVADEVGDEAKDAASEVAHKAKEEAQRVKTTAQAGAREVKDEAKRQVKENT